MDSELAFFLYIRLGCLLENNDEGVTVYENW